MVRRGLVRRGQVRYPQVSILKGWIRLTFDQIPMTIKSQGHDRLKI
jgi:hypothetical protein